MPNLTIDLPLGYVAGPKFPAKPPFVFEDVGRYDTDEASSIVCRIVDSRGVIYGTGIGDTLAESFGDLREDMENPRNMPSRHRTEISNLLDRVEAAGQNNPDWHLPARCREIGGAS